MPRVHMCEQPLCHRVIPIDQRYCDQHAKLHKPFNSVTKQNKQQMDRHYNQHDRDAEANAFYHDPRWTKVRDYVFNRDYAECAVCGRSLHVTIIGDHIVPRRYCDDPLDSDNVWLLCGPCHNIKTRLEESIDKQSNGRNKLRHLSRDWWAKAINERRKGKQQQKNTR